MFDNKKSSKEIFCKYYKTNVVGIPIVFVKWIQIR